MKQLINYFSENVEIKVKRVTVIMLPLIILGAYIAYIVHR